MIINVNPEIFRQYDIRGIFNKYLTAEVAQAIGAAYGSFLQIKTQSSKLKTQKFKVSVGRDVRLSSNVLRDALIQGIISTGVDVIDIGECPTPLQYFSIYHLNLDGGIMITGSHNPPEFNGFKITIGRETIYGQAIQEIRKIIEQGAGGWGLRAGKTEHYDIVPAYIECLKKQFLKQSLSNKHAIKLIVDAGNGTAGRIAPELLRALGCDVTELFCEPDGNFPNHHPDPTIPENLKDLAETVKTKKADFGIAYDGDADRIGVVDENGIIIWGDQLMIIFARDILNQKSEVRSQKSEGKLTFVGEVKCSQVMYDEIERLGGNAVMWKTGHSLIKSKMKETGAVLAGEMSGHMFFADRYFGYDDAIYASCRLAEIFSGYRLKEQRIKFSNLLSGLPKTYTTPEIRVDCPDDKKFGVIDRLSEMLGQKQENIPAIRDIIGIDGLRIVFDNGWALIRASNTQPVLVLRFEAATEQGLQEIKTLVEGRLIKVMAK
ncbi:MAG: phosphomannomutase/phosphoglucomutase [Deltaproteobacteria bacterium]|nr:phosphomannomutase/phosphoglucomutase [Deltaproteobacteria bacterium]